MACMRLFGKFDLPVKSLAGDVVAECVMVVGESDERSSGFSEFS